MSTDTKRSWWRGLLRFPVALAAGVIVAATVRDGATEEETMILAVLVAILFDQTSELGAK